MNCVLQVIRKEGSDRHLRQVKPPQLIAVITKRETRTADLLEGEEVGLDREDRSNEGFCRDLKGQRSNSLPRSIVGRI